MNTNPTEYILATHLATLRNDTDRTVKRLGWAVLFGEITDREAAAAAQPYPELADAWARREELGLVTR